MKNTHFAFTQRPFELITKLLLSFILADAAYIFALVQKMTENTTLALERYHTVPLMAEHILAACVLYLLCMILITKESKK